MSEFLRLVGRTLSKPCHYKLLSRDIVYEAKTRADNKLHLIRLGPGVDDSVQPSAERQQPTPTHVTAQQLQLRLQALALSMGEHRAMSNTADVTLSRMEMAWQLQQEAHGLLAGKFNTLSANIRTLARDIGLDVATASGDDVLVIVNKLDHAWQRAQESMAEMSRDLDSRNMQIKELGACMGIKTSADSSALDDVMVAWTDQQSKYDVMQQSLQDAQKKSHETWASLQDIARLMEVPHPEKQSTLMANIMMTWTRSQRKVNDLDKALQQETSKGARESRKNQARISDLESEVNDIQLALQQERENRRAQEALQLQKQARISDLESEVSDLRLALEERENSRRSEEALQLQNQARISDLEYEVTDLQLALQEERENSRRTQEALQNQKEARISDLESEVNDLQLALQEERKNSRRVQETFQHQRSADRELQALKCHPQLTTPPSPTKQQLQRLAYSEPLIQRDHPSLSISPSPTNDKIQRLAYSEPLFQRDHPPLSTSPSLTADHLQQIADPEPLIQREQPARSISYGSRSLSYPGAVFNKNIRRSYRSLQDRGRPTVVTSPTTTVALPASSMSRISVSGFADLMPWEESRPRILLGRGVMGEVFLFRHRLTKTPVALKIVGLPSVGFENEVRIHRALGRLPWFPAFYGTFKMAGEQGALAMEFIGGEADDKGFTIGDCIDNKGPLITRDDWFDILNDTALGLKAAHTAGYLVNDLKEDNTMLTKISGVWHAKIIDFGWASAISDSFIMPLDEEQIEGYKRKEMGHHIAPECVLEGKPFSTSSDVFSLGRLVALIGQEMGYDDFLSYGMEVLLADQQDRPSVDQVMRSLYQLQLVEGGEDGRGSSSC